MIAVAGATGRQGGAVARALAARGHAVRALTRTPSSPPAMALRAYGVQIVACDLGDAAQLDGALDGAAALFLTTTPYEHGVVEEERLAAAAIAAARRAGIRQLVYSSVAAADRSAGLAHFASKGRIEATARAAGFDRLTILRPTFFMEMFLDPAFAQALGRGRIEFAMAPKTRLPMIAVDDIAAFAVLALEQPERLDGAVIELAGDSPDMAGLAAAMSDAVGWPIDYRQVAADMVDPEVKPRLATQHWCEAMGWQIDIAALEAAWPVPLTSLRDWAQRRAGALIGTPEVRAA